MGPVVKVGGSEDTHCPCPGPTPLALPSPPELHRCRHRAAASSFMASPSAASSLHRVDFMCRVLHWNCTGAMQVPHWYFLLELHWHSLYCIGAPLALHQQYTGIALAIPAQYDYGTRVVPEIGTILVPSSHRGGTVLVSHWYCISTSVVLWYCIGT